MAWTVALSLISTLALHAILIRGVVLPPGTTNHGDPHLLCTPTTWRDVALFFIGNYGAHAATIISEPGQRLRTTVQNTILSLLFPASGVGRGLLGIARYARREKDELRMAARAGALCTVVKRNGPWDISQNRQIHGSFMDLSNHQEYTYAIVRISSPLGSFQNYLLSEAEQIAFLRYFLVLRTHLVLLFLVLTGSLRARDDLFAILSSLYPNLLSFGRSLHNRDILSALQSLFSMIRGNSRYPLALKSEYVVGSIEDIEPIVDQQKLRVSSPYDILKVVIGIAQLFYATTNLYLARGDQIDRYGYAAFALTLVPYIIMSFINLVACLLTPSYPTLYLVRSKAMKELEESEGDDRPHFDGAIGQLRPGGDTTLQQEQEQEQELLELTSASPLLLVLSVFLWLLHVLPFAIVGGISRLKPGQSTKAQRVWTMTWLAFGQGSIIFAAVDIFAVWRSYGYLGAACLLPTIALYAAPAIGGFVVVGQMLLEYGTCSKY